MSQRANWRHIEMKQILCSPCTDSYTTRWDFRKRLILRLLIKKETRKRIGKIYVDVGFYAHHHMLTTQMLCYCVLRVSFASIHPSGEMFRQCIGAKCFFTASKFSTSKQPPLTREICSIRVRSFSFAFWRRRDSNCVLFFGCYKKHKMLFGKHAFEFMMNIFSKYRNRMEASAKVMTCAIPLLPCISIPNSQHLYRSLSANCELTKYIAQCAFPIAIHIGGEWPIHICSWNDSNGFYTML